MAEMKFVKCQSSIHETEEWIALAEDPTARAAYFAALTSFRATYLGLFRYPKREFSFESLTPPNDIDRVIETLVRARLIEYDHEHGYVRLVGWFYGTYAPENKSTVISRTKSYLNSELPTAEIVTRSMAEFVCGSAVRTGQYDPESDHGPEVIEVLRDFMVRVFPRYPDLKDAINAEIARRALHSSPEIIDVGYSILTTEVLPRPSVQGVATVPSQKRREDSKETKKRAQENEPIKVASMPRQATIDSAFAKEAVMASLKW